MAGVDPKQGARSGSVHAIVDQVAHLPRDDMIGGQFPMTSRLDGPDTAFRASPKAARLIREEVGDCFDHATDNAIKSIILCEELSSIVD